MNFLKVLSLGVGWLSVHLCASAETVTFSYTGAVQSFVVPPSVTSISIEAWGPKEALTTSHLTVTRVDMLPVRSPLILVRYWRYMSEASL